MIDKWDGEERRKSDRRVGCYFPYCGSAVEIKNAHEQLMQILEDLKLGQEKILQISNRQAAVMANIDTMKDDIELLKKEMEQKLSKKDAIILGSVIGSVLIVIQFLVWGHGLIAK